MNLNKYLILTIFTVILTLSACSSTQNTVSNKMEGIELELTINKKEFSLNDKIIAKVILTNHNDSKRKIFAPIPKDTEEGISAIMVEKENKMLSQFFSPQNNKDIPNIKERSFYDFVLVELEANETIEQEFQWNNLLFDQENKKIVEANKGNYSLSAFIILDELINQQEYYEPEKQLISKLKFTVK